MSENLSRRFTTFGLLLQLALPYGLLLGTWRMFAIFGSVGGTTSAAAGTINTGVAGMMSALIAGAFIASIGVVFAAIGILAGSYRARWVIIYGRLVAIPWLIFFPLGTGLAIVSLVYFHKHQREFGRDRAPLDDSANRQSA